MGFWSKLGKIASFAAPLVAAPFTGGASLALIGAGAGAAGGLASGKGLKGALLGAGLGAIPGLGKAGALGGVGKALAGGGSSALGNVNGITDKLGSSMTKSLGGKLMDSLASPEVLKSGIGAALSGIFGGEEDTGPKRQGFGRDRALLQANPEMQRNHPEVVLRNALKALGQGGLAQIDIMNKPFQKPTVAPINFNANIPGLPFKMGLQSQGRQPAEPQGGESEALIQLRNILANL